MDKTKTICIAISPKEWIRLRSLLWLSARTEDEAQDDYEYGHYEDCLSDNEFAKYEESQRRLNKRLYNKLYKQVNEVPFVSK
jgi:hypothetical protein